MDIKKAQISVQTFFFILMSIFFVWILIFGYNQIRNVDEQISEQEQILLTKEIKGALEYCSDPLNKGSSKIIKIESKKFNGICLIGKNDFNTVKYGKLGIDLNKLKSEQIQDNVFLIKAEIKLNSATLEYDFTNPQLIDSFYADITEPKDSFCSFNTFELKC